MHPRYSFPVTAAARFKMVMTLWLFYCTFLTSHLWLDGRTWARCSLRRHPKLKQIGGRNDPYIGISGVLPHPILCSRPYYLSAKE